MANIMTPPILAAVTPGAGVDAKAQLPVVQDGSFAQHLDRQIRSTQSEKSSLVGVPAAKVKAKMGQEAVVDDAPAIVTVEAILQQLMVELKDMAQKPDTAAAGEWSFQLKDMGLLEKLAAQAGMDSASLALLKKQLDKPGGLALKDLFAALEKSFKEQGAQTKVTVPETSLPMLETLLSKLEVPAEAIQKLDTQAVNGVDQLDLEALLKGLQALAAQTKTAQKSAGDAATVNPAAPSCLLSDWDVEQLSAMLTAAGVPASTIESMLPEKMGLQQKALAGLRPDQGDKPVVMTMERLTNLLEQAITAVRDAKPKADAPAFLDTLNTIATQSGFQSKDVGWSPVIQGAMNAAYEKLQKMVDQGRDGKTMEIQVKNEMLDKAWQMTGHEKATEASLLDDGGLPQDASGAPTMDDLAILTDAKKANGSGKDTASDTFVSTTGAMDLKMAPQGQTEAAVKTAQTPRMPFSAQLQQLTVEQISQGVLRGLRNNEHHMTMTLYPKELGEVKVDLQVRGSQLSATFVMENHKVKEALESNMGEFKDNLERRGFSLGAMSVSVGQQHDQSDSNQRFAAAWEQMVANQNQSNTIVGPMMGAADFASSQTLRSSQGAGINLFV